MQQELVWEVPAADQFCWGKQLGNKRLLKKCMDSLAINTTDHVSPCLGTSKGWMQEAGAPSLLPWGPAHRHSQSTPNTHGQR